MKAIFRPLDHRQVRSAAFLIALTISIFAIAPITAAQTLKNVTRRSFDQWLTANAQANPSFKPGDVLTAKDMERVRPFVPPGYFEQLNFPESRMEIIAPEDESPRRDYLNCTEKYQAQARLNPDGSLGNFVCGQPFAASALNPSDPQSGLKAAWNFEYRWQNYGPYGLNFLFIYDRFGGSHAGQAPRLIEAPPPAWSGGAVYRSKLPADAAHYFGGGGTFDKTLASFYQRTYFSHLAQLADKGGLLPVPDAKDFLWKEFDGFFSPYDVRGQVFITYRYADPHRADDAWFYDPRERRVRRISVEVKSDSLAGTDQTQEDFYTFNGRELMWKWRFLGWKKILSVMNSKYDYTHFYGPNGDVPEDAWSLRKFAVVERVPKQPHHPYGSVVMFWDAENWHPCMALAFDRDGKLVKTLTYQFRWSEDFKEWGEINHGVRAPQVQSIIAVDPQKERATMFPAYGSGYPNVDPSAVKQLFDINKLGELHR